MLACFLCGFSYLGFTDCESIVPYANDYFKSALIGWSSTMVDRLSTILKLISLIGSDPGRDVITGIPCAHLLFIAMIPGVCYISCNFLLINMCCCITIS